MMFEYAEGKKSLILFWSFVFSEKGMFNTDFFYYGRLLFYFLMTLSYTLIGSESNGLCFYCEMKLLKAELQHAFMFG